MKCVEAKVSLVLSDLKASISACRQAIVNVLPSSSCAIADAEIERALQCAKANVVESGLCGTIGIMDSSISAVIRIICNPNTPDTSDYYLEIEPELIWVYPDFVVDNRVFSNTDWYIE